MKTPALFRRLTLLSALFAAGWLRADDPAVLAAVRVADDERVAATLAADPVRLGAVLSDELAYTHSNGKHDTKASYLAALGARRMVYTAYDYKERDFRAVAPDIVLMTAHVFITAGDAAKQNVNDVDILAVWRKEGGQWRFLAWQAAKLPAPAAPAGK